jgi:hypothetical protein
MAKFSAENIQITAPSTDDYELLPAGFYNLEVVFVEDKPNSKGTGEFTTVSFRVVDGEHAGRRCWAHYNLGHQKAQVAEIAQREITPLFRAAGISGDDLDTDFLLNERASAKVVVRDERNTIDNRTWRPTGPAETAAPAAQPKPQPQAAAASADW